VLILRAEGLEYKKASGSLLHSSEMSVIIYQATRCSRRIENGLLCMYIYRGAGIAQSVQRRVTD
jgi:hypothetical protein